MKNLLLYSMIYLLLIDEFNCQTLEALILGHSIKILKRLKPKIKDKKKKKYAIGAVVKGLKGTVAGKIGKPLKVLGILLGPFGIPKKIVGGGLKAKSVLEKTKAGVLTVKKWSRDSMRYG